MSSQGSSDWSSYVKQNVQGPSTDSSAPAGSSPGAESGSWWKAPAYLASRALSGAEGLLGLPGDIESFGSRAINSLNPWGIPSSDPNYTAKVDNPATRFPTGSEIANLTNPLGITNNPTLSQGRSLPVRLAGGVASALPAAVVDVAIGGAATPALISAGGAGLGSEAANEFFPGNTWAQVIGGLMGGYSSGKALQNVQYALGTHDKIINKVLEGIAPGVKDLETAGQTAQSAARDWLSTVPLGATPKPGTLQAQLAALWNPVKAAIKDDTPTDLTNFFNTLKNINSSAGKLEPINALLKPKIPERLGDAVDKIQSGQSAAQQLVGLAPAPFTWGETSTLRSTLGDALSNPQVISDVGGENLDRLYAALSKDMRGTAQSQGVVNAFDAANKGSTQLYDLAGSTIGKMVKGKAVEDSDKLPGAMVDSMLTAGKRDSKDLANLRSQVPQAADAIASAALRTGKWDGLVDTAKDALIPPGANRDTIESALQAKALGAKSSSGGGAAADLTHAGLGLAMGEAVNEIGPHVMNQLGIEGLGLSPNAIRALSLLGGYVLPKVASKTRNLISDLRDNPASRRSAALGAAVGASQNALTAP